ncbi:MAG: serine/threonine-protein kinase, partial [Kofleriaceae bacterium]
MTGCPEPFVLSAFVARALDDAASSALEEHIDVCELCRGGLAALVRGAAIASYLGRYRLGRLIGAGGMGIVYEAFDPELGRPVAIKVVRSLGSDDDTRAQRLRLAREARTLASIRHPNVCQVLDVGSEDDEVWVAMELVRGVSLRAWLATGPSRSDVVAMLTQLARGIEAAHVAGVCHGDVKPDNMLVEPGRAVVTDFGLARLVGGDGPPATSSPGGTPGYLAPERLAGQPGDEGSDQYAWCIVAAQALGARTAGFDKILRRGQARDPEARFPSMSALLAALDRVRRRRRVAIAIGAIAVIAAIATTAGFAIGRRGTEGVTCGDLSGRLAGVWDPSARASLQA